MNGMEYEMNIQKWMISLCVLMFFMCMPVLKSDAVSVQSVIGSSIACDPNLSGCQPFPSQVSILCVSNCPIRTSFAWTNSSRFWGTDGITGGCATSIDGGTTWGLCTTQPYAAAGRELYAGTADGSVIAVEGVNPVLCTIKRSINNGTSWSTVFTTATNCGSTTGLEGQWLYCLSDGRCELSSAQTGTAMIYRSSDNGQNWSIGETASIGNCSSVGSVWNGSVGINPSEQTGCGGGNIAKAYVAVGDTWTASIVWTGAQGNCWGPVIYNGSGRVVCANGTTYAMYNGDGSLVSNITLPGTDPTIDTGGPAYSIGTNTLYVLATKSVGGLGIYASRNNLTSFTLISSYAPVGIRGGNMFGANGCIYFTFGGAGANLRFGKIC